MLVSNTWENEGACPECSARPAVALAKGTVDRDDSTSTNTSCTHGHGSVTLANGT